MGMICSHAKQHLYENSDYSKEWNIANIMKVFDFWYEQEKEWNEDVPSEEEYVYVKDFLESMILMVRHCLLVATTP